MPWDEMDDPSDDDVFLPPLPQEDRLWRHPSEIAATGAAPSAPEPSVAARATPTWAVASAAGLIGAVLTMGVITLIGGLEPRVVERQVVERVAIPPVVAGISNGDGGIVEVAERIRPAIARLEVERDGRISAGSGVVFRDNGYLMTNAHVVDGARQVLVELADGRQYDAEIVGTDPLTDIAVLHVDAEGLPTAVLGEDVELRVGEPAIAIGSPAGLKGGPSVTTGVVSALGRRVVSPDGESLHDMIQFDAPITPGSSGGALVDARGAVTGITTAIAVTEVGAEGIGFATPIGIARKVADDIIETGGPRHPLLGVEGRDLDMASIAELELAGGAVVLGVQPGGPADAAGIETDDVITALDGVTMPTMSALVVELRRREPGETVSVTFVRGGEERTVEVVLAAR